MRKIVFLIISITATLFIFGCSNPPSTETPGITPLIPATETPGITSSDVTSSIVWKEVDNPKPSISAGSIAPFDIDEHMATNDYIFKGRILSHQNYEVSWTNNEGVEIGPFEKSILVVQVLEPYVGGLPAAGGTLRIYYPFSTDNLISNTFALKDGGEYFFSAMLFGERNLHEDLKGTPYYKDEIEKHADMSIGNNVYSALPIENGMVVANVEYDFEGKAVSLADPGSAYMLAPESFQLFNAEGVPIITFSLFSEDYFVSALRHFNVKEGWGS